MRARDFDIKLCFSLISKGDNEAFAEVFNQYNKKVYGVALKMLKSDVEAEEVVQEVFSALWRARERLNTIDNPEGYIFTTTYNTVYARLKKISRDKDLLEGVIFQIVIKQNTTQETIAARETAALIHKIVQQLPPRQRTVYELSKDKDLSYDEIAARLGLSKNTVRNHLAEAMKTIRLFLRNHLVNYLIILFVVLLIAFFE